MIELGQQYSNIERERESMSTPNVNIQYDCDECMCGKENNIYSYFAVVCLLFSFTVQIICQ